MSTRRGAELPPFPIAAPEEFIIMYSASDRRLAWQIMELEDSLARAKALRLPPAWWNLPERVTQLVYGPEFDYRISLLEASITAYRTARDALKLAYSIQTRTYPESIDVNVLH